MAKPHETEEEAMDRIANAKTNAEIDEHKLAQEIEDAQMEAIAQAEGAETVEKEAS